MTDGAIFTSGGAPVATAADYQRQLDTRWQFMDMVVSDKIQFSLPPITSGGFYTAIVYPHGLNFIPPFSYRILSNDPALAIRFLSAKTGIYVRADAFSTIGASVLEFQLTVYNLDIAVEFTSDDKEFPVVTAGTPSPFGMQFLDTKSTASLGDSNPAGFSINTEAKAIGIQKHGIFTISPAVPEPSVEHDLAYPPTYLLAPIYAVGHALNFLTEQAVDQLGQAGLQAKPDVKSISFRGDQAELDGDYAYIILKDPAEISQ